MEKETQLNKPNVKTFFLNRGVKERILDRKLSPLEIIKILLKERAMKQVNLADKIGMTRQGLNNYIRGHWAIPTQIKIKIAQALNVDSSVIWDLPNDKKIKGEVEVNSLTLNNQNANR